MDKIVRTKKRRLMIFGYAMAVEYACVYALAGWFFWLVATK